MHMKYYKNQLLTVSIEDMSSNGEGIGRYDGYTLFVKDAVIGDVVVAKLTGIRKNYAYARCEKLITPSPKRTRPFCDDHMRCGGCQIQSMSYEAQLKFKENKVKNNLIRIGNVSRETIESVFEPIIGMNDPVRYRNKSQYPVGCDRDGNPTAGFYALRTHSIIPCNDCKLAPAENAHILEVILSHMKEHDIKPYDEKTLLGTIRHVLIRKGFATGQLMVCLVIKHDLDKRKKLDRDEAKDMEFIPGQAELVNKLQSIPGMTSVCVSINNDNTNVIMGNRIYTLWGDGVITDTILGKTFEISPLSFFQVNPVQVEKLYRTATEYAGLSGREEVWDICCGIGTITICMSEYAKQVYGIEVVPEAIEDAKRNAVLNNAGNVSFICAAAEDYLKDHADEIKADVVILDPPRKGMDEAALSAISDISPGRIVYISCDSATLARDIKYLTDRGYVLQKAKCIDMFPHTVHTETCCLLERLRNAKDYIPLKLDMEDYYKIKDGKKL